MMATEFQKSQVAILRELIGTKCRCGANKRARQSFCGHCYFRLPNDQRRALYARLGNGYELAYDNAVATLRAKGRIQ